MNKTKEKAPSSTGNSVPAPTIEEIRKSVKVQLEVAHYALGLMLRHPQSIHAAASEMYEHVMRKEGLPGIDTVDKN